MIDIEAGKALDDGSFNDWLFGLIRKEISCVAYLITEDQVERYFEDYGQTIQVRRWLWLLHSFD